MIWRLVLSKMATLQEIETHWSINDLAEANEVLDYKNALEQKNIQDMKRNKK